MTDISIIGTGNMARTIGARAITGGNTVFRHVLEKGRPDVFIAGDDEQAKASVEAFVKASALFSGLDEMLGFAAR
jgi:predicted dinucleotide-binding enzyme